MPGTIQKLREILIRREKIHVAILLVAIIAMAFSQAVGVASVLPGWIHEHTKPYWKHLLLLKPLKKDRALKSHLLWKWRI